MRWNRIIVPSALVVALLPCAFAQQPDSTLSPRDQLQQYVTQLQANPTDDALRTKIIQLATTLDPQPAIPEEANRHFVRAAVFMQTAHGPSDYDTVIDEFSQALLLAPWWGDAYWNLSIVEETAGRFDEATNNVKFYLLTHPAAEKAKEAQDKIYAIEAERELAAKRSAKAEAAAKEQQEEADWKQLSAALAAQDAKAALAGPWALSGWGNCSDAKVTIADGTINGSLSFKGNYTVNGSALNSGEHDMDVSAAINGSIADSVITGEADFAATSQSSCKIPPGVQQLSGALSTDGRSLKLQTTYVMYDTKTQGLLFTNCISVTPIGSQPVQCTLVSKAPQLLPLLQVVLGMPPGSPQISQTAAVRLVLAHGGDVNAADSYGMTALHYAANQDNAEIAKLLLNNGANVNAVDKNNDGPLNRAIESNSLDIVKLLLTNGAQLDAPPNQNGMTPLDVAVVHGDEAIVVELLQHINNPNQLNESLYFIGLTSQEIANLLLARGADVNSDTIYNSKPLSVAIMRGCGSVNALILTEYPRDERHTPCYPNDVTRTASLLITHGAMVNARDANGATALMRAAETGNLEVLKLLITHGADIHALDSNGNSALEYAKFSRNRRDRKATIQFLEGIGLEK